MRVLLVFGARFFALIGVGGSEDEMKMSGCIAKRERLSSKTARRHIADRIQMS